MILPVNSAKVHRVARDARRWPGLFPGAHLNETTCQDPHVLPVRPATLRVIRTGPGPSLDAQEDVDGRWSLRWGGVRARAERHRLFLRAPDLPSLLRLAFHNFDAPPEYESTPLLLYLLADDPSRVIECSWVGLRPARPSGTGEEGARWTLRLEQLHVGDDIDWSYGHPHVFPAAVAYRVNGGEVHFFEREVPRAGWPDYRPYARTLLRLQEGNVYEFFVSPGPHTEWERVRLDLVHFTLLFVHRHPFPDEPGARRTMDLVRTDPESVFWEA